MFVVRRTFRDRRGVFTAGSVVEPADIVRFKYRRQEKHIIEVDEQNYNEYYGFFKKRYNVELPPLSTDLSVATLGNYALGKGPVDISDETIQKGLELRKQQEQAAQKPKAKAVAKAK